MMESQVYFGSVREVQILIPKTASFVSEFSNLSQVEEALRIFRLTPISSEEDGSTGELVVKCRYLERFEDVVVYVRFVG